jgi:hypothetical protein
VSEQQTGVRDPANRAQLMFFSLAGYLIVSFLWRVITPAHEYAMRDELYLTMVLDGLCIIGLVGIKQRVEGWAVVFWIALAAGIGMFLIRLAGDDQWWTGHVVYYLEPRRF